MKSISDSFATNAYTYDYAGRKLSESNAGSPAGTPIVTVSSQYDVAGNRTRLSDNASSGRAHDYVYDRAGRLTTVRFASGEPYDYVAFRWTDDDQLAQLERLDPSFTQPITDYAYERATGRLSKITHRIDANGFVGAPAWMKLIDEYSYSYDRDDRITKLATLLDGTATYTYDKIDQLTFADRTGESQDETYAYDEAGNRLTSTVYGAASNYSHGTQYQQNRLSSDGVYSYLYDNEGNVTQRHTVGESVYYTWDHRNRLIQVEKTTSGTLLALTNYTYDALDRRIKKVHDPDGNTGSAPVVTEKFAYDGDDLYLRYNGANSLTNRYLHGPAVDQVLLDEGNWSWLLTDHENSVRDVVALFGGTHLNHKAYDSFGNVRAETNTNASFDTIFGYTGREWDEAIGMQYNRAVLRPADRPVSLQRSLGHRSLRRLQPLPLRRQQPAECDRSDGVGDEALGSGGKCGWVGDRVGVELVRRSTELRNEPLRAGSFYHRQLQQFACAVCVPTGTVHRRLRISLAAAR